MFGGCATTAQKDPAKAYYDRGLEFEKQRNIEKAVAEYREAILLKPHYPEAHYRLGCILSDQSFEGDVPYVPPSSTTIWTSKVWYGKLEEATGELREAIEFRPNYYWAMEQLAIDLDDLGRRKEARPFWEKALKLEKNPEAIEIIKARLAEQD